jgi:hypothetical protein
MRNYIRTLRFSFFTEISIAAEKLPLPHRYRHRGGGSTAMDISDSSCTFFHKK